MIATSTPAPGGKPTRTFDPQEWLSQFAHVGGAYTVTDKLNLFICVPGRTDEELSQARQMIVDLIEQQRAAIFAHLEAVEIAAMGEC